MGCKSRIFFFKQTIVDWGHRKSKYAQFRSKHTAIVKTKEQHTEATFKLMYDFDKLMNIQVYYAYFEKKCHLELSNSSTILQTTGGDSMDCNAKQVEDIVMLTNLE